MYRIWGVFLALLLITACSKDEEGPKEERQKCRFHSDCKDSEVCFELECYPTTSCFERSNCKNVPVCAEHRCFCHQESNRCLPVCVTDNDCSEDGHCLDGICQPYPVTFGGTPPTGNQRGGLQVGVARVPLDFPVGVSLGGYGSRSGPRTPYQELLGGSHSWFDRPDVRAVAFDDGKEVMVLLRIPLSWSTDYIVSDTTKKVEEMTGLDLSGRIITSALHSHAHPARYWHLVVGLGMGFFGYGEYDYEVFDRMTTSFATAVSLALDKRAPGKFGYSVLDNFDPNDRIHRDRRERNNNLPGYMKKDDRMVVMRVDDASGSPLAVLTNFGIHGTIFSNDNPIITGDAPAGIEVELTTAATEKYGQPVLGIFVQGNAGDISPGGDSHGHSKLERMQVIGRHTWEVIEPALDSLTTSDNARVAVFSGRVPISHSALGYGEGKYYDPDTKCEGAPDNFRYGAFQCVGGYLEDEDPATAFSDGDLGCVFAVECLTDGFPVPQFHKTNLAVAHVGGLTLGTLPGEPLSQYGRDYADKLREATSANDAMIVGFSMDHHFYLLNEDDWLQGGYEPSMDIWGWRLGPYLIDAGVAISKELTKEPEDRIHDNQNLKPMYWVSTAEEMESVPFTETVGDPGEILEDVPQTVERLDEVQLAWSGGHPGLDLPVVTLEKENAGNFEPHRHAGGAIYDDSGFEMIVKYEGTCSRRNCEDHKWRVRWQDRRDFPTGSYRLSISGRAFKNGQSVDYATTSATFEVVPSSKLWVYNLSVAGGRIGGRIVDPGAVQYVPDGAGQKGEKVGFLLRSVDVPAYIGAPLADGMSVTVTGNINRVGEQATPLSGAVALGRVTEPRQWISGFTETGEAQQSGAGDRPTSTFEVDSTVLTNGPAGDYYVELTLTDPLGNSGTVTATITK